MISWRSSLRLSAVSGVMLLALSCGRFGSGVRLYVEEPFPERLSAWRLFLASDPSLKPNQGVVPYDLNTPLFSDYADKYRFVWMPAGTSATYDADDLFEFPVGTIISKTFAFPDDKNPGKERLIETRLLVRGKSGWVALPYVWNAGQTEATLELAANPVQVAFTDPGGRRHSISYNIPNTNECAQCHERSKTLTPIGLKARNLNKDVVYGDGAANQLAYWTKIGYLKGAPAPGDAPRVPVWNDPKTGSLAARARAYLDNNCAHCHQTGGVAGYTGALLSYDETDRRKLGFFKLPNSAGYTGNRPYDIVPGKPEDSILLYRMESTKPKEMMPEIGRALAHREGIALVREWLSSLPSESGNDQAQSAGK
jgi:uncharacterized repeat protein (TIGR03806 family)